MNHPSGRHFLQIPGPTNVPDRVLRAMAAPTIDHRGPEFGRLAREVLGGVVPGDWRHGVAAEQVSGRLSAGTGHAVKAVTAVHNETSTGAESSIRKIRAAIDSVAHPALLIVDAISSLGSIDYQHDE